MNFKGYYYPDDYSMEPLDWRMDYSSVDGNLTVSTASSSSEEEENDQVKPKACKSTTSKKKTTKAKKASKEDKDKPRRILTAYNFFFQHHRQQILDESGKVSFAELAREISKRWKNVSVQEKAYFQQLYQNDIARNRREMEDYKNKQLQAKRVAAAAQEAQHQKQEAVMPAFDESKLLGKAELDRLANRLGSDCTETFIRLFR